MAIHVYYVSEKQPYRVCWGCKSNDFLSDNIMNSIWNLRIKLLFASCTVVSHIDVFGWNLAVGQSGELHSLPGTRIPLGEVLDDCIRVNSFQKYFFYCAVYLFRDLIPRIGQVLDTVNSYANDFCTILPLLFSSGFYYSGLNTSSPTYQPLSRSKVFNFSLKQSSHL